MVVTAGSMSLVNSGPCPHLRSPLLTWNWGGPKSNTVKDSKVHQNIPLPTLTYSQNFESLWNPWRA